MLKVTSVDRKAARRQLHLDTGDSGASGSMTQELLGLCSGQFAQGLWLIMITKHDDNWDSISIDHN